MSSEVRRQILQAIEDGVNSRPSAIEFEMAYHVRVAIDRIRFAIKHSEKFGPRTDQAREVGMQLFDALERLETIDRRFQVRSLTKTSSGRTDARACSIAGGTGGGAP